MGIPEPLIFVLASVICIFGIVASLVYYFVRYYFQADDEEALQAKTPQGDEEEALQAKTPQGDEEEAPQAKTPQGDEEEAPQAKTPQGDKEEAHSQGVTPSMSPPEEAVPPKRAKDLHEALLNTRNSLWGRIKGSIIGEKTLSDEDMESLEEILYTSDLGPSTVQGLMESVGKTLLKEEKTNAEKVRQALRVEMNRIFGSLKLRELEEIPHILNLNPESSSPQVWMIVGVNGAGKTTTIGKLAYQVVQSGQKVMVVAGDTFRAAAEEQLKVWSERAQVELFNPPGVTDPSAVVFDACVSARSKKVDVVIIDTAGRLHTQNHLMEELKKMKRVVQKVMPEAPHEVFVVLDANSGQNALIQAKFFNEAVNLTGVILTKLDGSAKGGVALGLAYELNLSIRMIGVGESLEDLRPFHSQEFVDSII